MCLARATPQLPPGAGEHFIDVLVLRLVAYLNSGTDKFPTQVPSLQRPHAEASQHRRRVNVASPRVSLLQICCFLFVLKENLGQQFLDALQIYIFYFVLFNRVVLFF